MELTWLEGLRIPWPDELDPESEMPKEGGLLFHGAKGKIMAGVTGNLPQLLPASLNHDYKRPPKTIPRVQGQAHEKEWVRACKEGRKAVSNFESAALLTEICLLGNIAKRVDTPIDWDGPNMKVTNSPEANQYVRTEYRKGWSL